MICILYFSNYNEHFYYNTIQNFSKEYLPNVSTNTYHLKQLIMNLMFIQNKNQKKMITMYNIHQIF
jgi:hypothetical protein